MRVTEKGQVTIPKHIRDRLGIRPGSEVEFVPGDGRVEMVVLAGGPGEQTRRAKLAESLRLLAFLPTFDMGGPLDGKQFTDWTRGTRDDGRPG